MSVVDWTPYKKVGKFEDLIFILEILEIRSRQFSELFCNHYFHTKIK